jgi:DNA-binding IclR family transcriptional regulator
MAESPDYAVPALDKALDVLELLAGQAGGLSQSEIADATGRSASQLFRVLALLERRGYLVRENGLYLLSTRLFSLAHRHPPLRGLIAASTGPMRDLAEAVQQSCNLSIVDAGRVLVIAQVESPADFGYRVRVGATFDLAATATGMVLTGTDAFFERPDPLQPGITDVVVRIDGPTRAALTVPYVATTFSATAIGDVRSAAIAVAREISTRVNGR